MPPRVTYLLHKHKDPGVDSQNPHKTGHSRKGGRWDERMRESLKACRSANLDSLALEWQASGLACLKQG